MALRRKQLALLGIVVATQVVDAGLHVAINQVEPLRILSNAVLTIAVVSSVFAPQNGRMAILGGAIGYVALNLVFVALYGLENPVSGVIRAPLFVFMVLSLWFTYRLERLRVMIASA
ncbi:hypothetical protein [Yoonia sp. R2-816]|uniref:hypothetical protein n=1 Tax=Yoonia sp. R2-816 TaxID=3342638 RepID=UPI003729E953